MTKMFSYVVCLIISILICNATGKPLKTTTTTDHEPKRCCWANKLSGDGTVSITTRTLDNTTQTINMNYRFAYDGNRDLMGMKGEYKDSTTNELTMFWTIQNFDEKRSYTINETSKECLTSLLLPTTSASVCIPETATYIGSNTTQFNNKAITTDTWRLENNGQIGFTTVTRDHLCVPLIFRTSIPDIGFEYIQTTSKAVAKIKNANIIKIPEQC